jgi:hypothetical protein
MFNVMASPSIASLIDDLLAAPKELGGVPDWRDTGVHSQHRLVVPVLLGGASTGLSLEVTAYPNMKPLRFNVMLNYGRCIWRIDYAEDDVHINSFNAPAEIAALQIVGPHYHQWSDNKHFSIQGTLPLSLRNARPLGVGIRSFDSAMRWLCAETNIGQPPTGGIVVPPRTRLI